MKKISQVILFVLCASGASAQLGFEGGLNMANLNMKSLGAKVVTNYKAGVSAGISIGVALNRDQHLYFAPEILFQEDGATVKGNPNWPLDINSITIPLFFEYRGGTRCGSRSWIGVGPYLRDNISGSEQVTTPSLLGGPVTETVDLQPGKNIQTMDYGIGFNAGFIPGKHWYFRINYLVGLANNLPGGDNNNYIKQSTGGVTVGYMIRGCRERSHNGAGVSGPGGHWRGIRKGRWSRRQRFFRDSGPDAYQ